MPAYITLLSAFLLAIPTTTAQLSERAQSLGLNATWYATYPSSPINDSSTTVSTLTEDWNIVNYATAPNDVLFVADPFDSTNNASVLQVYYQAGSYAPSKGIRSGTEFLANPFRQNSSIGFQEALLSYKVGFPTTYNWVLAGKLPGLFGGPSTAHCSGGQQSTGSNCFSVRMMWRQSGIGEAYAYIPADSSWCSANSDHVLCNDEYGKSIGRGTFSYTAGKWTQVELYLKLNSPSQQDGVITVWINGNEAITLTDVPYHTTNLIQIESIFFSTFFGGSSQQYATPTDQYSYFKDFQLSVGPAMNLTTAGSGRFAPEIFGVMALAGFVGLIMMF